MKPIERRYIKMTQEQREILIRDLAGRIQDGTIMHLNFLPERESTRETETDKLTCVTPEGVVVLDDYSDYDIDDVKPYLRWKCDMTSKEREEYEALQRKNDEAGIVDFYHKNHFDYRGLLPMGLALEAPDWMYI